MADEAQLPELISAMLEPGFQRGQTGARELRETHISWVILVGERAYKVKKPLVLPFLDFGTLERRHEMCREEVRLNRRLAPGIYRRVVAIVRNDGGYSLASEDFDDAVEYAVEMSRIEEDRTFVSLLRRGELQAAHLDSVAGLLARFHREAAVAPAELRWIERLVDTLDENLATLREVGGAAIGGPRLDGAAHYTDRFVAAHREQFGAREAKGLVRDCHGDLRAEHVVVPRDGDLYIFDCVEFNPALRQIDVAADLAFLVMDLTHLGAPAMAERLVTEYRAAGGDAGDEPLLAFYASYRAWVRAKVACLRAAELTAGEAERAAVEADAGELFELGERFAWRSRRPLLLAICGVAASGKTTLAAELSARSGLPHISSDVVRKRLAGLEPTERAAAGHYTPAFTDRTYRELGRSARAALDDEGGAIVDATFHLRSERDALRSELGEPSASVLFVECRAPRDVLVERIRRRAAHSRTSDADESVLNAQLATWERLDEIPDLDRIEFSTEAPNDEQARRVEAFVDERAWI
jgi:aminoglycoside phosphotransferase family enzyme/predicted kinase